jgi:hypothetical protein
MNSSIYPVPFSGIQETKLTTTGDTLYASAANTAARLGIGSTGQVLTVSGGVPSWATPASGSTFVGASVSMSGFQSVNDLTETILLWNTEQYDTDSIHNTSSNTDRMTVPTGKGGKWLVTGTIYGSQLSGGYLEIFITVNGAAAAEPVTSDGGSFKRSPTCVLSRILDLSAGDYIRLVAYQGNNGGAKNLGGTNSRFQFTYLGA